MTVASQVKRRLPLRGYVPPESMAAIEKTPAAQQLLSSNAEKLGTIINKMEQRVGELEYQEPQYKGF